MVQKVISTTSVSTTERVTPASTQPGSTGPASPSPSAPLPPATQVHLSEAGSVSAALSHGVAQDPLDAQLIQEIRQRIDSGQFQIDFDQVAANILREAVASAKSSQR